MTVSLTFVKTLLVILAMCGWCAPHRGWQRCAPGTRPGGAPSNCAPYRIGYHQP